VQTTKNFGPASFGYHERVGENDSIEEVLKAEMDIYGKPHPRMLEEPRRSIVTGTSGPKGIVFWQIPS